MTRLFSLALAALLVASAGAPSAQITLERSVVAGGGATDLTSASYRLGATLGQPAAGPSTSASYTLGTGFWYGSATSSALGLTASAVVAPAADVCTDVADAATCDFSGVTGATAEVAVGARAAVQFTFTNTSAAPTPADLDIDLSDPNLGTLPDVVTALPSGSSATYAATFEVTASGAFSATATGEDADLNTVTATAAYSVTAPGTGIPLAVVLPGPEAEEETQITIDIVAGTASRPVTDLFGVGFEVAWDPAVLTLDAAALGPFLDDGSVIVSTDASSPARPAGTLAWAATRQRPAAGVDGTGVVATLTFSTAALDADTDVTVSLSNVQANDRSGALVDLTPQGATLTVLDQTLVVWPGDANNDGVVDENDVLLLGPNVGATGPARGLGYDVWAGQPAEPWTPEALTYVDTDGDGAIDRNDLLPIGVHFLRTHGTSARVAAYRAPALRGAHARRADDPVATVALGPAEVGSRHLVPVLLGSDAAPIADLYGVAAHLALPPELAVAGTRPGAWLDDGDLIEFVWTDSTDTVLRAAYTRVAPSEAAGGMGDVLSVEVEVVEPLAAPVEVALVSFSARTAAGDLVDLSEAALTLAVPRAVASEDGTGSPDELALLPPRPNPARTSARLAYALPELVDVRVRVFDPLGRQVASFDEGARPAGEHEAVLDVASLAAGVYVVRLEAGPDVLARVLTVVR